MQYDSEMIYVPKWWKVGRPREFFMREEVFIKDFIAKYKLRPVSQEVLKQRQDYASGVIITDGRNLMNIAAATMFPGGVIPDGLRPLPEGIKGKIPKKIGPPPPPGGLKGPHLHYKDKLFLLNDKQWDKFSQSILIRIKDKLTKARSISFDQLMDLTENIQGLG